MKIVNASIGKISTYFVGPKQYLNENIRLGEVALCIGRDDKKPAKPFIWIIGGREQLIDYVSLARTEGEIADVDAALLLSKLDDSKKTTPKTAMERLASILSMEVNDLLELANISQVCISAPIAGIQDYSQAKPVWTAKQAHASIH
jgi:hypothetical protein